MKKLLVWIFILLWFASYTEAQVAINSNGSLPHESAMLDIVSSDKGMLIPRLTSSQRTSISNPSNSLLVFDETTTTFWFFDSNSSTWKELSSDNSTVENINGLSDAITSSNSIYFSSNSGVISSGNFNNSLGINSLNNNTSGESNLAIGYQALINNTSGSYNIGIGTNALGNNQTGSNNTAVGYKAGEGSSLHNKSSGVFLGYMAGYNETNSHMLYIENSSSSTPLIGGNFEEDTVAFAGDLSIYGSLKLAGINPGIGKALRSIDSDGNAMWSDNADFNIGIDDLYDGKTYNRFSTFLGYGSGEYNNINYNTAAGYDALSKVTYGKSNVAFGINCLSNISNGDYNVALGNSAIITSNAIYKNVAIGSQAGSMRPIYEKNVLIGYRSGRKNYSSNILSIDNNNDTDPLFDGNFETDTLTFNGVLEVKDTLYLSSAIPGSILMKEEWDYYTEYVDWKYKIISLGSLTDASTDNHSIYINSFNNGDSLNTVIGSSALKFNSSGGTYNLVLGTYAMAFAEQADSNVIIGSLAGYGNNTLHTSQRNIFIGYKAGYNELGSDQLYIENSNSNTPLIGGDFAEDTLAIAGDLAVYGNIKITGGNPANGKVLSTDANGNTSWEEGSSLTMKIDDLNEASSDNSSIFLGYRSGSSDNGTSNTNTSLGAFSMNENISGSNNVAMGYYSLYSNIIGVDNVGIGFEALKSNTKSKNTAIGYQAAELQTTYENTTAIGYESSVTGSNRIRFGNSTVTQIGGNVSWSNISDQRFKKNINENVIGLDFIMKLKPVSYQYDIRKINSFLGVDAKPADLNSQSLKEAIQYSGFIAQEVDKSAKSVAYDFSGIHQPEHAKDHYSISYSDFVVPLVKAVQERQIQINEQKETIQLMQKKLDELKTLIDQH